MALLERACVGAGPTLCARRSCETRSCFSSARGAHGREQDASETPGQTEPVGAACRAAGACDAGAATSVEADSEDASAPDADGGSAAQSVDYSCSTDGDCEVKDLGGCCGYNPRCVNRLRDVPGFECPPGGASPCGFLVIDACVCRDQVCRNVQGDREI